MKKITLLLVLILFTQALFSQDDSGVTSSRELFLQASSLPEAKVGFTQRYRFPFLQGESPLTEGNNINFALVMEVTPVSLNGQANAFWTPIAFIELAAGVRLESGWSVNLFGSDLYGIGLNKNNNGTAEYDGSAFDGLLWKAHFGGAFQFDLAAIFPGDWNHVVFRSYHEINHRGYSRAKSNEAWYYENEGENMNGFNYYGNFLIGYQMPIFITMAAILVEMDLYLYDTPGRKVWGDDLIRWNFSGILNFQITEQFSLTAAVQFRTIRNFTQSNWEDLHYQARIVNPSDKRSLEFHRVAAVLTYRF